MMRHRVSFTLWIILTVLMSGWASHTAYACSCESIEPDIAYQRALLIFIGKVEKSTMLTRDVLKDGKPVVDSEGRHSFQSEGIVTHFSVEEYFKGNGGPEVKLTGTGTTCDINFEAGKRYIVYASQNGKGGLGAFTCSRTMPLNDYAQSDVSYLRRTVQGGRPTMFYGFAYRRTGESRLGESEPVDELAVIIEGEGKRLNLKTNASGYFETFDLLPGSYRVRTGVTGKLRGAEEKTVELISGSVTSLIFRTTTMGSLKGRLIDQDGQPAGNQRVNLLPAKGIPSYNLTSATTDEDGKFDFDEVAAGSYMLAVNFRGQRSLSAAPFLASYYPNAPSTSEAQIITVADGVQSELDDFVLQKRYPTVSIKGIVVTSDGKPIAGAYIYMEQNKGGWDSGGTIRTDAEGRFTQQGFEGVTYTLHAGADGPTGVAIESDPVEVTVAKNAASIRLVIKMQK